MDAATVIPMFNDDSMSIPNTQPDWRELDTGAIAGSLWRSDDLHGTERRMERQ